MEPIQSSLVMAALATLGTREESKEKRSSAIGEWIDRWFRKGADDSSTAWCAIWMAQIVSTCDLLVPKFPFRASSWKTWGQSVKSPEDLRPGDVIVVTRSGGFHVTMLLRYDASTGLLWCIGGNQSNMVSVAPYPIKRLVKARRPG
jgi:uncharacterized protein (TIGR02594 family)